MPVKFIASQHPSAETFCDSDEILVHNFRSSTQIKWILTDHRVKNLKVVADLERLRHVRYHIDMMAQIVKTYFEDAPLLYPKSRNKACLPCLRVISKLTDPKTSEWSCHSSVRLLPFQDKHPQCVNLHLGHLHVQNIHRSLQFKLPKL